MEIAELILILRNEVQRSYDLIEDNVEASGQAGIYMTVERMEIDIPITLSAKQVKVNVAALKKKAFLIQKFELPLQLAAMDARSKSAFLDKLNDAEIEGNSIDIALVGPADKKDSSLSPGEIGHIKLVLKPVTK